MKLSQLLAGLTVSAISAGSLLSVTAPAQAVEDEPGTLDINSIINIFPFSPFNPAIVPDPNPAAFWFLPVDSCLAAGSDCEFSVVNDRGHFDGQFAGLNALSDGYQYALVEREQPDRKLDPGSPTENPPTSTSPSGLANIGSSFPSLYLDPSAFLPFPATNVQDLLDGDGNVRTDYDLVASNQAPADVFGNLLESKLVVPDGGKLPFLTLLPNAGEPLLEVSIKSVNSFVVSEVGDGFGETSISATVHAVKYLCGNTIDCGPTNLGGSGAADVLFLFGNDEGAGDISLFLEKKDAPEPSSMAGLALLAAGAGLSFKKKKEQK